MRKNQKIRLSFPYKMMLFSKPSQRALLVMGHIFLALNVFAFFLNSVPLPGILLALICFSTASMRKDIFSAETVTFSFRRLVLAVILVISAYLMTIEDAIPSEKLWVLLLFVQTPLSINDAIHIYRGKIGITMF